MVGNGRYSIVRCVGLFLAAAKWNCLLTDNETPFFCFRVFVVVAAVAIRDRDDAPRTELKWVSAAHSMVLQCAECETRRWPLVVIVHVILMTLFATLIDREQIKMRI